MPQPTNNTTTTNNTTNNTTNSNVEHKYQENPSQVEVPVQRRTTPHRETAMAQRRPRDQDLWDPMSDWGFHPFNSLGRSMFSGFSDHFQRMEQEMSNMMGEMNRMSGPSAPWQNDPFGDNFGNLSNFDETARKMGGTSISADPNSSSWSYSSSSFSSSHGPDGKPISRRAVAESKSLGGVAETHTAYCDSFGNERMSMKRGLGNKARELIKERNAKGEERSVENLQELEADGIQSFDQQWEAERAKVDPQRKVLGVPSQASLPQLKGNADAKPASAQQNTTTAKPAEEHKTVSPKTQSKTIKS